MFPFFIPVPAEEPTNREKFDDAKQDIRSLRATVTDLQNQVERQRVLLQAVFGLLRERQGLTEADLLDHFRRVMADGARARVRACTQCGRPANMKFERCLYCEAPQPATSAFELT